jgi:hypothetical protein
MRGPLFQTASMNSSRLLSRIRLLLGFFATALLLSGLTAIPLTFELAILDQLAGLASPINSLWPSLSAWVSVVRQALDETYALYPFIAYGTDWLAFGHIVLAIAFIGPIRDPARNIWVIDVGIVACALLIPYAILFGPVRGIPPFWTFIDTLFGILGIFPLLLARYWAVRLSSTATPTPLGA